MDNSFIEIKGGKLSAGDASTDMIRLEAKDFEALGPKAYPAVAHSYGGIIKSTKTDNKFRLVNAVIGGKGLVTFVADIEDSFTAGQELILEFTEVVDDRARFNVIQTLPQA